METNNDIMEHDNSSVVTNPQVEETIETTQPEQLPSHVTNETSANDGTFHIF